MIEACHPHRCDDNAASEQRYLTTGEQCAHGSKAPALGDLLGGGGYRAVGAIFLFFRCRGTRGGTGRER